MWETVNVEQSAYVITMGLLLGTTFYTTFVSGIIQFKNLPKLVFGNLQSKQFPPYFFYKPSCLVIYGGLLEISMQILLEAGTVIVGYCRFLALR